MNKILEKRGYKENFEKLSKSQNSLRELSIKQIKNKSYSKFSKPMQNLKRVHIDKSFVIVFSVDESKKKIIIEDYDHHDKIYR